MSGDSHPPFITTIFEQIVIQIITVTKGKPLSDSRPMLDSCKVYNDKVRVVMILMVLTCVHLNE